MNAGSQSGLGTADVERWPTEMPLFALSVLVSLTLYLFLLVTVIGLIYAGMFVLFFVIVHAALFAHVRGSAVRLGPQQLPDLHRRVLELAQRIGLDDVPDAYLMQGGGVLNAFAARFLGLNVIVLYSDLLEACGDNDGARDMIIAHELGHLKAGHLRHRWLTAPTAIIPFLGGALSRAREYTCDRYGLVGAGERSAAVTGLTILAAGGAYARAVNRQALAEQQQDLNTGWITIGEWMGSHPPLSRRIAALEPALLGGRVRSQAGRVRAAAIIACFVFAAFFGAYLIAKAVPAYNELVKQQKALQEQLQQQAPQRP